MKRVVSILIILLITFNLSSQNVINSKLASIDIMKPLSTQQEVPLSMFVNNVNYIPLETKTESLISGLASFEITDDYVIVKQSKSDRSRQILLFDRNTGKWIREIGKYGNGPGEFRYYSKIPFDSEEKEIYAVSTSLDLLVYDLFGKNIEKISKSNWKEPEINLVNANSLNKNTYVTYVINSSGKESKKLILFSKGGILKTFPNYMRFDIVQGITGYSPPGGHHKFYRWDNRLYFLEAFCDTLYQITSDILIPRFYFYGGKFSAPYSKQIEIGAKRLTNNYFFITNISENKNFLFMRIWYKEKEYTSFLNKTTNQLTYCKINSSRISGFIDDVTNLTDVIPQFFTNRNEMVYVIQPVNLLKWLKENPDKGKQAFTKMPWLKEVDDFSNPIIAIAKCKE